MKIRATYLLILLHAELTWGQQREPVFRSPSDSIAFHINDVTLRSLHEVQRPDRRIDSLQKIRTQILQEGLLGWRYTYHCSETFTCLSDLDAKDIDLWTIKTLSISDPTLQRLPTIVYKLHNLQVLELVNTHINAIPARLQRLTQLHVLNIYNNKSSKPLKLRKNKVIRFLKIRSPGPGICPTNFKRLPALDSLDLDRNFLTDFPLLSARAKIRKLLISENNLTLENWHTPKNKTLEVLYMRRNKIETVPDAIGKFTGLKKLSLNHNEINELSPQLANLKQLEELSLYQNNLVAIPKSIYALTQLKEIDLYFNKIQRVDPEIINLKNLEVLYLSNNRLYALPDSLGYLSNLRALYLHHNRLSYLPSSIGNLTHLKVLRFNDNFFPEFPDQVTQLANLENLDFSRNRIANLPLALGQLQALKLLVMTENPWEDRERVHTMAEKFQNAGTEVRCEELSDIQVHPILKN